MDLPTLLLEHSREAYLLQFVGALLKSERPNECTNLIYLK